MLNVDLWLKNLSLYLDEFNIIVFQAYMMKN